MVESCLRASVRMRKIAKISQSRAYMDAASDGSKGFLSMNGRRYRASRGVIDVDDSTEPMENAIIARLSRVYSIDSLKILSQAQGKKRPNGRIIVCPFSKNNRKNRESSGSKRKSSG